MRPSISIHSFIQKILNAYELEGPTYQHWVCASGQEQTGTCSQVWKQGGQCSLRQI